jgi:hypothetical protein
VGPPAGVVRAAHRRQGRKYAANGREILVDKTNLLSCGHSLDRLEHRAKLSAFWLE